MKVNSRKVAALAAMVLIPTSYDSIMAKMPRQLISVSIDNAREMRDYYNVEKQDFRYSNKTADLLGAIVGNYEFDNYSNCGQLINSGLIKRKVYESKLDPSCLLSFDSITSSIFKTDPSGGKFFYGCLFDGNKASYCLSEYRPGKNNNKR